MSPLRSARRLTVLVVDDCKDTTASFAMLLEAWGHEAVVAGGGAEALDLAAERRPDLAILDLRMPGMGGYEVARRLQAAGAGRPFLVAMTADASDEARRGTAEAGCDLHLIKPVAPEEVKRLLDRLAERCDDDA